MAIVKLLRIWVPHELRVGGSPGLWNPLSCVPTLLSGIRLEHAKLGSTELDSTDVCESPHHTHP